MNIKIDAIFNFRIFNLKMHYTMRNNPKNNAKI